MTEIETQPYPYSEGSGLWVYDAITLTVEQVKNRLRLSRDAKGRTPVLIDGVWYWEAKA